MINPDKYLMVCLRLSKEAAGADYHKILSASRRCLDNFSLPFDETGYRLVLRSEEAELVQCLNDGFMGVYTDEDMIFLSAPARDDYSEYYYQQTETVLLDEIAQELRSVAERVRAGSRITSRTYAESIRLVNRVEHHFTTEETSMVRDGLSSVYKQDVSRRRKSTARYLNELADLVDSNIEWEE